MSNRVFKSVVCQIKEVIGRDVGILDDTGRIIACSDGSRNDEQMNYILDIIQDNKEIITYEGYTFQAVGKNNHLEYIAFVSGDDNQAQKYCALIAISIENIKQLHNEKYDKGTFVKNVILDNTLQGDIIIKATELHIEIDAFRVAFLVRSYGNDNFHIYDIIQNLFPMKDEDFVFAIDDNNIVLVKEVKDECESAEVEKIAKTIMAAINMETSVKLSIGIGTIVSNIRELAKSYKEARVALEVGKVFENESTIINYDNLGIGRLIYQLPTTLCTLFLSEVFKKESIDTLDEETISTINKFFENNLNVSEASRKLYVHRNTLVYRLDKIQKLTGLDLRIFDHAIVFKVAMMVKKYLDSNPIKI